MRVAFDTGVLSILLVPESSIPDDPETNEPVELCRERVQELVARLSKESARIVIPWPAMAEFMQFAYPNHTIHLAEIKTSPSFELVEFGERASIELTELNLKSHKPKKKDREGTWAKLKYDRQITAIAIAKGCTAIYSTDRGLRNLAEANGVRAYGVHQLPVPQPRQSVLFTGSGVVDINAGRSQNNEEQSTNR